MAFESGEALLEAVVVKGGLLMVDTEEVERGGVEFLSVC